MPSCIRHFHRTCGETTVGLTTKMCYFIGHGQTNKVLVEVVNKDQTACYSLIFLKVLCVLRSFGLSWKPWMSLMSHCALLMSLQCKVERWKKEIPDLCTMLQNTHIFISHGCLEKSPTKLTLTLTAICATWIIATMKIDCGLQLLVTINKAYQRIPQNTLSF